jgi:hypothetical protein
MVTFRRWMLENGIDDARVWPRVVDLIIKTMISVESNVVSAVKMSVPHGYVSVCYHFFFFPCFVVASAEVVRTGTALKSLGLTFCWTRI